jgi:hypothetical protein
MSDDEAEDGAYRAKLAAQTMRWRLFVGVGSWGLALAACAALGLVLGGAHFLHVEGRVRFAAYAAPVIATFAVTGYLLLRVGEIDVTTGRLVRAAPIPWPRILGLVILVAVIAMLVLAWPLGVYTSLHAARTSCGQLVPIDLLRARTTLRLSVAAVSEDDGCDVVIAADGRALAQALVRQRAVPDDDEWRRQLSRYHPDVRTPLDVGEGEGVLLENDDVIVIAMRRGALGSFVQLRREAFDRDDAIAIAARIGR